MTFVKEFNHFGRTNVLSNNVLNDKQTRFERGKKVNQKEHESCFLFRDADHQINLLRQLSGLFSDRKTCEAKTLFITQTVLEFFEATCICFLRKEWMTGN